MKTWTIWGIVLVLMAGLAIFVNCLGCGAESKTDVTTTTELEASNEAAATSTAEGGDAAVDSEISASIEGSTVTVAAGTPPTNMWDFLIDVTSNWFVWITVWAYFILKAFPNKADTFGFAAKG